MFNKIPVCKLMISCPSDIKTEVGIIEKVVQNFNDTEGIMLDVFVKTLHWAKNVIPEAGDTPQSIINKQILSKSDAVVAIFNNKLGESTERYESGTIEEIELMYNEGKQIFVYFAEKPMKISEINFEEKTKIEKFKAKYKNRGIYWVYESDEEFNELFSRHLAMYLIKEMAKISNEPDEKTRFNDSIKVNKEVDLFYDYTKFYDIKPVISNANPNLMQLSTHKDCFEMNMDISSMDEQESQEFIMAMFEYAPCDNWAEFYEAEYFLEFDAVSSGAIKGFQLEIKNDVRNKIIDRYFKVSNKGEHFKIWLPSTTRDKTTWRNISQVCFIIFFNKAFLEGRKGTLLISNLKMIPK